jgi:hypothetical protein
MLHTYKSKVYMALGLACFLALNISGIAGATATYDISTLTSGVVEQVQASLATVLPIAGGLLALGVGFKLMRRLVKA